MKKPAVTGRPLTRREFAMGTTTALGALAVGGTQAGAQTRAPADQVAEFGPFEVPPGTKQFSYHTIMNNDAVRIEMPVGVVSGSSEGPTLIVTGGLFATEYSGVEAASRMYRDFVQDDIAGRVIIIPVITMDAFRFRTPMFGLNAGISPMDGKSLNSVFPGDPDGSATEVLAHYLFQELVAKSDYHIRSTWRRPRGVAPDPLDPSHERIGQGEPDHRGDVPRVRLRVLPVAGSESQEPGLRSGTGGDPEHHHAVRARL